MAKLLYINGYAIDLNEKDSPIACSYAVNDLAEVKNRQGSTTNRFKLPITENNRQALGFPDYGPITQIQPYRTMPAKIIQNGIEIVPVGFANITGVSDSFIEVQVISGVINFFDQIEAKMLHDLRFPELEHAWNLSNVIASLDNTDGYTYPLIDYGGLDRFLRKVDVRLLRPAMFEKTVIDKIITSVGYTYEGKIFSDDRAKKAMLPFSLDDFEHGDDYVAPDLSAQARKTQDQVCPESIPEQFITFQDYATSDPSGSFDGTFYTAQDYVKVKISLNYDIIVRDVYNGPNKPFETTIIYKFNASTGLVRQELVSNTHMTGPAYTDTFYNNQKLIVEADLIPGDQIYVVSIHSPLTDRCRATYKTGARFVIDAIEDKVIFGQTIQLEKTLPDISQKDFLKAFLQRFGLIIQPDDYKKHLVFAGIDLVYYNKYKAKDWTDKFLSTSEGVQFTLGDYGQINYAKYKDDENVPANTGQGQINIDNTTLPAEKELFTQPYAASVQVIRLGGLTVTEIKKISNPIESLNFDIKTEQRILIDQKTSNFALGLEFTDGTTTLTPGSIMSVPYFVETFLPGLSFDELIDAYYHDFKTLLNKTRKVKRDVYLNERDIAELDFFIPIYDSRTATYYYLNQISNFQEAKKCVAELIKM